MQPGGFAVLAQGGKGRRRMWIDWLVAQTDYVCFIGSLAWLAAILLARKYTLALDLSALVAALPVVMYILNGSTWMRQSFGAAM